MGLVGPPQLESANLARSLQQPARPANRSSKGAAGRTPTRRPLSRNRRSYPPRTPFLDHRAPYPVIQIDFQQAAEMEEREKSWCILFSQRQMISSRTRCGLALIAALLIPAGGCHSKHIALSPEHPEVKETFDVAQAMNMLYGNYDPREGTSFASLPREKSSFPEAGDEDMTVRPLFHPLSGDAGAHTFLLLTYAIPTNDESFDCHACAPTIGMAVFSLKGSVWTIDASNRAITFSGGWGKPPTDIELVQIGPNRQAVKVIDVGGGQGETSAVLDLLIPWNGTVELGLERILFDDDSGLCEPRGGLPCYANRRTITFIHNHKSEYYGLKLKLTGTDWLLSDASSSVRRRKVHGLEILKLEDGKYVQISRQGDLTNIDRVVAEREGLR
jgi:hypothetical protein